MCFDSIHTNNCINNRRQIGSVLIVCLIALTLLTLIGMGTMTGARLDERMTANFRDRYLAEEDAQAALRKAELYLATLVEPPELVNDTSAMYQANSVWSAELAQKIRDEHGGLDFTQLGAAFWEKVPNKVESLSDVKWKPRYVIEAYMFDKSLSNNNPYTQSVVNKYFYRITARAQGHSNGQATLQTIFSKQY